MPRARLHRPPPRGGRILSEASPTRVTPRAPGRTVAEPASRGDGAATPRDPHRQGDGRRQDGRASAKEEPRVTCRFHGCDFALAAAEYSPQVEMDHLHEAHLYIYCVLICDMSEWAEKNGLIAVGPRMLR